MADVLPRLTHPEMARLVEIGTARHHAWIWIKPVTTGRLRDLGLVVAYSVRPGPGAVYEAVCLTDAGREVLAGFAGDEFEMFREVAGSTYNQAVGREIRERRIRDAMSRHPDMSRAAAEAYADQGMVPDTTVRLFRLPT